MNILFTSYFPTYPIAGGVQRVTTSLTKELLKKGYNIYYLCYKYTREATNDIVIPQYFIDIKKSSIETITKEINSIVEKHSIDVIINQTPDLGAYKICKQISTKVKVISVIHTQPYSEDSITWMRILKMRAVNFKHFLFKMASLLNINIYKTFFARATDQELKMAFEISEKVCFISERFYPRVKRHLSNVPYDKLVAINNPNTYEVCDVNVSKKDNLVLWVGRVSNSNKNTLDFIKAWQYFQNTHSDWKAIIIGEGEDLAFNINYVRKHKVENIEFIGRVDNVAEWYKRAKVVAVTSWGESWCLAITEGMQYGCIPCVYNTYETLEDIVDNNINGFIVQPTPQAMSACFRKIATDVDFEQMSEEAQKKVLQFSIEKIADKWDLLLKNL